MQYRTFGQTNEKVSVLGFGIMRLPIVTPDLDIKGYYDYLSRDRAKPEMQKV